jgi:hypothetical protein
MSASLFHKKGYENESNPTLGENKPNSKPISQRPKMSATVHFTRNYENNPAPRLRQNKPKTKPISEEPKMNVTVYFRTNYANQSPWGSKSNQTQLSARSRLLEPSHHPEKAHHYDCCHEQAPPWRKAQRAGRVGKEQGESGHKQTVGQLRAHVLYKVARAGNRAHNCRVGDGRTMVTEDCAIQNRPHAYHRGKPISLSVERKGNWNACWDQNSHRSVTCPSSKRCQRGDQKKHRWEPVR